MAQHFSAAITKPAHLILSFRAFLSRDQRRERRGTCCLPAPRAYSPSFPLIPNHFQLSRYSSHLGFLLFKSGNNRKLFTPANAATGSKYQASPPFSCRTTCAASTSMSSSV